MQHKNHILNTAMLLACGITSTNAFAALPTSLAILNFNPGVYVCVLGVGTLPDACSYGTNVTSGSYFGMDTGVPSLVITSGEKKPIVQFNGIYIGVTQSASGAHGGKPGTVIPNPENPNIDQAWSFGSGTGLHRTTTAITILSDDGAGNVTLNFSGWNVTWNAPDSDIPMGSNAWGTGFTSGVANVNCANTCENGDTYVLDYTATVPTSHLTFGDVPYSLHLEGTISVSNTAPVANDFSNPIVSGATATIDILPNVSDAENNIVNSSIVISNQGSLGVCTPTSATANANGTVSFPNCPAGTYTFDYTISDPYATSAAATVTVVASANPPPTTSAKSATTDGVTPVDIDVTAGDTDNSSVDTGSVAITQPTHGTTVIIQGTPDLVTYTADAGFSGIDTFTYTVNDDTAQTSAPTTVTVTVNALNDPSSPHDYTAGTIAAGVSATNGVVTATQIGVADTGSSAEQAIAQSCIGGCFDFELQNIGGNGATARVILPLSAAIPVTGTLSYRKLINGSWQNFEVIGNNAINTAQGTYTAPNLVCPPANAAEYSNNIGLTPGHRCVRLSIVDGGPNDADGMANGTVVDPGGIAETTTIDIRTSGTDGCSMTGLPSQARDHADWALLAGFIALLGWFSMKRRKA